MKKFVFVALALLPLNASVLLAQTTTHDYVDTKRWIVRSCSVSFLSGNTTTSCTEIPYKIWRAGKEAILELNRNHFKKLEAMERLGFRSEDVYDEYLKWIATEYDPSVKLTPIEAWREKTRLLIEQTNTESLRMNCNRFLSVTRKYIEGCN